MATRTTGPPVLTRYRMPFGKHKGQTLDKLPDAYLAWLLRQELRGTLLEHLRCERDRRHEVTVEAFLAGRDHGTRGPM